MKLLMRSVAMASALTSQGVCEQQNPQSDRPYLEHTETSRLYFSMPLTVRMGRIELTASDALLTLSPPGSITSAEIESVLQLTGNVRVRMCAPSSHSCEKGSILLRADAVDYNEQTREINAHGNVHIEPPQTVTPR
jgi:lipopolysaccharide assembly outer membrane protein LptD (OstA)